MDLTSFGLMLDENKMSDMTRRMKELRALNKPAEDIVKEFAEEFYTPDSEGIERARKFLVGRKPYLKDFVNKDADELNNIPKREIEKLRNRFSEYMSAKEFNSIMNRNKTNAHKKIVDAIVDRVIEKG